MCLINPRSCNNKTALMKQFINDLDLDICAITETWLKEDDEISKAALKPEGYEILSSPCPTRLGGGIAVIYTRDLKVTKSQEHHFRTCKCTDYKISFHHSSYSLGLFYRPDDHPFLAFINDMVEYMENNITDKSEFLLLGDFSIHVNKLHDEEAITFHDFLSSFGLQNHVLFPKHRSQNILDLVITHVSTEIVSNFRQGEMMSDHFAVLFDLHIPSRPRHKRLIKFRKVKEIDASTFVTDLQKAFIPLTSSNLDELTKVVDGYNKVVASVLDQYAPLKTRRVVYECYQPWYCCEIGDAVRYWRKLEGSWRADVKSKDKWAAFDKQRKITQVIIKKRERILPYFIYRKSFKP